VAAASSGNALKKFAESQGLAFAERVDLPQQGSTLARSGGRVQGRPLRRAQQLAGEASEDKATAPAA
jgi:hypothetical protein